MVQPNRQAHSVNAIIVAGSMVQNKRGARIASNVIPNAETNGLIPCLIRAFIIFLHYGGLLMRRIAFQIRKNIADQLRFAG